eukprot:CAMPEP_0171337038 /NCGR_PEP_ID=MMETSP0878-20121228/6431_1 /TAXON_ID=67004 /ORGANISM="Thalassiosira weissflogii, Strain CCMP1336" /LENGTH=364 /DNA_ID=CAMNT_0011838611 /DNA_START=74 /DNA_END=1168 /DNA_ORIENTATION=-
MGAVHGVYLKYVGLSAVSFAGYHFVIGSFGPLEPLPLASSFSDGVRILATSSSSSDDASSLSSSSLLPLARAATAAMLSYSTFLNGTIAVLFQLRRGMSLIGKDTKKGTIPLWSYVLLFPFHGPTYAYTYLHTKMGKMRPPSAAPSSDESHRKKNDDEHEQQKVPVPVASQVQPGWWVGGCYSHEIQLPMQQPWAGIVDLTVEFPEKCRANTLNYLCLPTWDGVPCSPEQLEEAAVFCMEARKDWIRWWKQNYSRGGNDNAVDLADSQKQSMQQQQTEQLIPHILIHCAHGRGRSTTVMCAAMVKMGLFSHWEEALEQGIRPSRPVCKLNAKMRKNLEEWQRKYVDHVSVGVGVDSETKRKKGD